MRYGVVLDPDACNAEPPCQRGRVDERSETRIERQRRLAVEWQPFPVAPQGGRPAGDGLAVGERALRIVHGIERAETLRADGHGGGCALGPAMAAPERPCGERR